MPPSQAVLDAQKRRAELMAAQKTGNSAKVQQISAQNKDVKVGTTGAVSTPYAQDGNPTLTPPTLSGTVPPPAAPTAPGVTAPTGLADDTPDILKPPTEQPSISEHLQQTYRERADQQEKGSYLEYAETFEAIMGKPAPFKTREEYIDWRKRQNKDDLDFLDQQIGYSRQIEELQFKKARDQAAGAVSATNAQMAQGREGPVSGSAGKFMKEFGGQMGQYLSQLEVEKASAELSREKQRADLKRAEEAGDMELVDTIQGRISSIEDQIREIDRLGAQTELQVGEFELKKAEFQHSANMDWQANYRANFGMYNEMVMSGLELSPNQINKFAKSLGIPFEVANSFYEGSQMVRANNKLDLDQKNLALQDLAYGFQLRLDGIVGERAEQVNGIMGKVKSGAMTWDEAGEWMMNLGIPSAMNPVTRLDMQMQSADLLAKQIANQYLPAEKRQSLAMGERALKSADYDLIIKELEAANAPAKIILEMKKAGLDVEMAELQKNEFVQSFSQELPDETYEDIFFQKGTNRSARSKAGGDNVRECGEGYNDITDGPKVGDGFNTGKANKMSFVTHRDNPRVGEGVVSSHGGTKNGHIETVISVNPVTKSMVLGGWNYYGDGKWSTRTVTVDEMNQKYGGNWGFTDSKLKSTYKEKLSEATSASSAGMGSAEQIANTIMSGNTGMTIDDVPQKERASVAKALADKKQQSLSAGDTMGFLRASAGGKPMDSTGTQSMGKALNVMSQLDDLENTIMSMDTGPITGVFRSNNPYDVDQAKLKAQLQAIVPNLARGVYGEVGVLTDSDIKNYIATLPNGFNTEDQKKALMTFTKKVISRSIENSLKNYAMAGYNVSGYVPVLEELTGSKTQNGEDVDQYGDYYIPASPAGNNPAFISSSDLL